MCRHKHMAAVTRSRESSVNLLCRRVAVLCVCPQQRRSACALCVRLPELSCVLALLVAPCCPNCNAHRLLALLAAGSGSLSTVLLRAVRVRRLLCSDDVLAMGIDKYNAECRSIVTRYCAEWEVIVGVRVLPEGAAECWAGGHRGGC